jgi:hypothetical protein
MSEQNEWGNLIPLPALLPNGQTTIVWWEKDTPLPETFILKPRPDEPGTFDFIITTGAPK